MQKENKRQVLERERENWSTTNREVRVGLSINVMSAASYKVNFTTFLCAFATWLLSCRTLVRPSNSSISSSVAHWQRTTHCTSMIWMHICAVDEYGTRKPNQRLTKCIASFLYPNESAGVEYLFENALNYCRAWNSVLGQCLLDDHLFLRSQQPADKWYLDHIDCALQMLRARARINVYVAGSRQTGYLMPLWPHLTLNTCQDSSSLWFKTLRIHAHVRSVR